MKNSEIILFKERSDLFECVINDKDGRMHELLNKPFSLLYKDKIKPFFEEVKKRVVTHEKYREYISENMDKYYHLIELLK